eukprot:1149611-Pelagomonas_calceolata.AAC.2
MKLPDWSFAASYLFVTSHNAEYPMWGGSKWPNWVIGARSDQDSKWAAGTCLLHRSDSVTVLTCFG